MSVKCLECLRVEHCCGHLPSFGCADYQHRPPAVEAWAVKGPEGDYILSHVQRIGDKTEIVSSAFLFLLKNVAAASYKLNDVMLDPEYAKTMGGPGMMIQEHSNAVWACKQWLADGQDPSYTD